MKYYVVELKTSPIVDKLGVVNEEFSKLSHQQEEFDDLNKAIEYFKASDDFPSMMDENGSIWIGGTTFISPEEYFDDVNHALENE